MLPWQPNKIVTGHKRHKLDRQTISALDKVLSNWVFWAIFTYPFLIELCNRIFTLGTLLC